MPIDLTTEAARIRYHNTVLRVMSRLEGTVSRQLKPVINRQYMDAASLLMQGVKDVDHVVNEQNTRLRKILRVHYRRVATTAGRNAIQAFDPAKSMGTAFWSEVNSFIAFNTARKITKVQGTTKKMLNTVIQTGVQQGQTNAEIATRIRKTGKIDSQFRAMRIARTETLGIYNAATDASVADTGLKFKRVWSTTKDSRTRRRKRGSFWDHWSADKQKRDQNEDFVVSGESLKYPGDPKGSAGNIINCRCVLIYEREREQMKPTGLPLASTAESDIFPAAVSELVADSRPMSSIGRFSNCILPGKSAKDSGVGGALDPCVDYTRMMEGKKAKWFFKGKEISGDELDRLNAMRLPPAWSNVVASADPLKKVQAIGMDKAGRWQYRYSAKHIEEAAQKKFNRQKLFAKDMTGIRKNIDAGISKEDPRAYLLRLEDKTAIRAGSRTDFKAKKKAYGLTTLQHEHLTVNGNNITLKFIAKEGLPAHYELKDAVLAKFLKARKALL